MPVTGHDTGGLVARGAMRRRLEEEAGLTLPPYSPVDVDEVERDNWDDRFVEHMQRRMVFGFFRYGPVRDPRGKRYDNVRSAIERLELYLSDGNLEHLCDAANLCLCEWVKGPRGLGSHPDPHLSPVDDGRHTPEVSSPR